MDENRAFRLSINGTVVSTGGTGPEGHLACYLNWGKHGRSVVLTATAGNDRATWPIPEPKLGDVITIELLDTDAVDPASHSPSGMTFWEGRRLTLELEFMAAVDHLQARSPRRLRAAFTALKRRFPLLWPFPEDDPSL